MARLSLRAPSELARFIAPKGSVALDGVSLTVNEVEGDTFSVLLIPHTLESHDIRNAARAACGSISKSTKWLATPRGCSTLPGRIEPALVRASCACYDRAGKRGRLWPDRGEAKVRRAAPKAPVF